MGRRIGVVGIIIEKNRASVEAVNRILSENAPYILGRMGIPNREKDIQVISLIVEIDSDHLGALTGKLGKLDGVIVKSALTTKEIS